ncbi:LOW QUALITY PROTEIN: UBN2 domain-containing protein, partial [Cephalotus follicularis]
MTIFIQSLDYNLWDLIVRSIPSIRDENGEVIPKPRNTYNDDDRRRVQLNAKAKHVISYAINSSEFNRVSSRISAKEMWDRLEITYEGTNQVKDAKISMLVHDYELFSMNEDEDIKSMVTRFTNIINALQSLDKTYSNRSLITHELTMQKRVDDEEKEKKKKNVVALKSSEIDDSDDDEDDDDEDLALFTRKFQ